MINTIKRLIFREKTSELEFAHGFFDRLEYHDDVLTISGWMMLPDKHFDSITLYINQDKMENTTITKRKDVAGAYPHITHAENSGFSFSLFRSPETMGGMFDICAVGVSKGREIAKMETWFRSDLYFCLPKPPAHLMSRITANDNSSIWGIPLTPVTAIYCGSVYLLPTRFSGQPSCA